MVDKISPVFEVKKEENKLKTLTNLVLKYAKTCGADAAEVAANFNAGLSTSVRMREIENIEFDQNQGFGITVYFGKKKGSASSSDTSEAMLKKTVEAACNIAKYTQEDDGHGLAEAHEMAVSFPELDLYHPWGIDAKQAIDMAMQCEQAGLEEDTRIINSEGASVSSQQGCSIYANSHGFMGVKYGTMHSINCILIGKKGDEMQRDYWYSIARDAKMLESVPSIGKKAAQRSIARLGSQKIKTGLFPVIFESDVASSLIGSFLGAVSGGALYRDGTFLKDSIGRQVFPQWMNIHEDPYLLKGLSSKCFDGDGLQTRKNTFVSKGVVTSYILGTYFARKLGLKSTANSGGVSNMMIDSNAGDLKELLGNMKKGLLVTEFMGSSINLITGDYSRGVAGFWVENGEIAYPVSEVTIAGNLKEMFKNIVQIGSDIDNRSSIMTGSIYVNQMMIAGR